jgi:hypothetical protein
MEDEDREGLQNVGFFTVQPLDLADSPRELHNTRGHVQITKILSM